MRREARDGPQSGLTSLVFPTYNPGPQIERTWEELRHFLSERREAWEVLFVCDGCTDGSDSRLEELIASGPECVHLLRLRSNRGKGHAVRRGLLAAHGDWRLFADVDLAYGFDDIVRVAETLWNGSPVAVASRCHPASRLILPPHLHGYAFRRHLQSQVFGTLARTLLPLTQRDPQAGLKGLSAAAAELLLPQLRCDGFGFDCELLTSCVRHEVPVTEVPVCVRFEDGRSTTGLRSVLGMLLELWRIHRTWRQAPAAHPVPLKQRPVPMPADLVVR
jgi:dolichyl-phosphate beta-glucosyltransferase